MLNHSELEELKKYDAPTICNAIQLFDIRPKSCGFMDTSIKKVFNNSGRTAGYACTAKISAMHPAQPPSKNIIDDYYELLHASAKPSVSVIQDIDPHPIGSFWGEVQATVHLALGCNGAITSGGVRDLDEAQALGFEFYSKCILVSHAYIHVVEAGGIVDIGGLAVRQGELVFADKHGVVVIPDKIAPYLVDACKAAVEAEYPVLTNCRKFFGGLVPIEYLKKWRGELASLRSEAEKKFSSLVKE